MCKKHRTTQTMVGPYDFENHGQFQWLTRFPFFTIFWSENINQSKKVKTIGPID